MKKTLIFALIALFAFNAKAQNNVSVFSEDGHAFYLILNGVRQNENPETNVRLEGLMQEMMAAKIIFNDQSIPDIDKKFFAIANDQCRPCDVTYKIKTNKKGEVVMRPFAFNQLFNAPPPPQNVTVLQYNTTPLPPPTFGVNMQVGASTTTTTTTTTNGINDNVNVGMNVGGLNMGVNVNVNDGFGATQQTTTTTHSVTTNAPMTNQTVVNTPPPCNTMNGPAFQNFLGSVNSKGFDEDRLTIAKQATSSNCLTAQQIRQVMEVFSFEDTKLDYARFAYNYCLDQNNYWQVNDAFDFDSSIEELNNSIRR